MQAWKKNYSRTFNWLRDQGHSSLIQEVEFYVDQVAEDQQELMLPLFLYGKAKDSLQSEILTEILKLETAIIAARSMWNLTVKHDENQVTLSAHVNPVAIDLAASWLGVSAGLYLIEPVTESVTESATGPIKLYRLNSIQAVLIDLLGEERKYSLAQLLSSAAIEKICSNKSESELRQNILNLQLAGFLRLPKSSESSLNRLDVANVAKEIYPLR